MKYRKAPCTIFLMMNTWMFETFRRQCNWIKSLIKIVSICWFLLHTNILNNCRKRFNFISWILNNMTCGDWNVSHLIQAVTVFNNWIAIWWAPRSKHVAERNVIILNWKVPRRQIISCILKINMFHLQGINQTQK